MKGSRRWLKWACGSILFLGLCFLMAPLGNAVPILFVTHLGLGWWWHAASVLPPLLPQWTAVLLPLACLAISVPLAHRFMAWLAASRQGAVVWRWSQTLSVLALLLLGSAAAIAMSGITHQLAWLLSTPSIESTGPRGSFGKLMDRTRDWAEAVREFEIREGRYPDNLAEVASACPERHLQLRVAPATGQLPEPFIYIKPSDGEDDVDKVMLVSPARPNGLIFVGFVSGRVLVKPASLIQELIEGKEEP